MIVAEARSPDSGSQLSHVPGRVEDSAQWQSKDLLRDGVGSGDAFWFSSRREVVAAGVMSRGMSFRLARPHLYPVRGMLKTGALPVELCPVAPFSQLRALREAERAAAEAAKDLDVGAVTTEPPIPPRADPKDPDALLDTRQAAALLGMTPAALRARVDRGTLIPFRRVGRSLRFRRADLLRER